ncbi:MAG TPA: DUF2059 domain-containing protein [Xanthobacteraceae bacterium]|nr:DUF2059 domain-containing protein [Xanthobacteraceae bacterium]
MFSFVVRAAKAGIIAAVVIGAVSAANAQTPSANQLKLARQVVDTSGAAKSFDSVIPQIFQQVYATYTQQNPDLSKEIAAVMQGLIPEFDKRKEEIAVIVSRAFAAKFSEAELNDILAFYNSPTGKKLVTEHSEILRDAFGKTQEWGGKLSQQLVDRLKDEMKKKGHTI